MTSKHNIFLKQHQIWTLHHEKPIIWHTYRHTCKIVNFDHRGHDSWGQNSGQMTSKHNISLKQHQNWTLRHEKPIIWHTYHHTCKNINFDRCGQDFWGQVTDILTSKVLIAVVTVDIFASMVICMSNYRFFMAESSILMLFQKILCLEVLWPLFLLANLKPKVRDQNWPWKSKS